MQDIEEYALPPHAPSETADRQATLSAMKKALVRYESLLKEAEAPAAVEEVLRASEQSWEKIAAEVSTLQGIPVFCDVSKLESQSH